MKLPAIAVSALLLIQAPSFENPSQISKGSIHGGVLRDGTGEPLAGVRVGLLRGSITENAAITGKDGAFAFTSIEPGNYGLVFGLNGYVKKFYGETAIPYSRATLTVGAGQSVKDLVVRMTQTSSVGGRIADANGQPTVGVPVQLLRYAYNQYGGRTFEAVMDNARTNDRGEYRYFWITPGRYFIAAGGARQNDTEFNVNEMVESYGVSLYPGVTDWNTAQPIEIASGMDLVGIDITLDRPRLARIRGRVIDGRTGQPPASAEITMDPQVIKGLFYRSAGGRNYDPSTGGFEIKDVMPAEYKITARVLRKSNTGASFVDATVTARIRVSGIDQDGVVLTARAMEPLAGRVRAEEGALFAPPREISLRSNPTDMNGRDANGNVKADGTFVSDVSSGEYRVSVLGLPQGFYFKAATYGGIDVMNSPLRLDLPISDSLQILLGAKVARVDGKVTNENSQAVPGGLVVLVPDQRDRPELYLVASLDSEGRFTLANVAPGNYKAFAWQSIELYSWFDPEILRRFELMGKPVHLGESAKEILDLRVISAEGR